MNFIENIFKNKVDSDVHIQFQKFSKGTFINKALINVKNSKGRYTIKTSPEFAKDLVKYVAKKLGDNKTKVKGAIISTADLSNEIEFKEKKQFRGVKKYLIEKELNGKDILELIDRFPKVFFGLSFNDEKTNTILKIKPKAPKTGKPKKKEKKEKPNFCSLKTNDKEIAKSFIFEKPDFREAEVNHTFLIEELILPKGEEDYSRLRELAKRKGKIIRKAIIDNKEYISEKEFEA